MILFVILLLIGQGSAQSQCYTSSNCAGDTVPADDARDCCVGTNDGQSYGIDPGNCEANQCIGECLILECTCLRKYLCLIHISSWVCECDI